MGSYRARNCAVLFFLSSSLSLLASATELEGFDDIDDDPGYQSFSVEQLPRKVILYSACCSNHACAYAYTSGAFTALLIGPSTRSASLLKDSMVAIITSSGKIIEQSFVCPSARFCSCEQLNLLFVVDPAQADPILTAGISSDGKQNVTSSGLINDTSGNSTARPQKQQSAFRRPQSLKDVQLEILSSILIVCTIIPA